jgi:hypothetical protein
MNVATAVGFALSLLAQMPGDAPRPIEAVVRITDVGGVGVPPPPSPATTPPQPTIIPATPAVSGRAPVLVVRAMQPEVRGVVDSQHPDIGTFIVQVLVRRVYDSSIWVEGTSRLERRDGAWHWSAITRLRAGDFRRGYELVAMLVPQRQQLPSGLTDRRTINQVTRVSSKAVPIQLPERPSDACAARIQITEMEDLSGVLRPVQPHNLVPIDVGWTANLRGEVDLDTGMFEYVLIRPITSNVHWIMERKGQLSGRRWTETAYFGRSGLDGGELFRVMGIVVRRRLQDGDYKLTADTPGPPTKNGFWSDIEKDVCAVSDEILVRRSVGLGELVIRNLRTGTELRPVRGGVVLDVELTTQIAGDANLPKIAENESVWVFYRPVGDKENWVVGTVANTTPDGLQWHVPYFRLPSPGRYDLMAVSAFIPLQRRALADEDWYQYAVKRRLHRFSRLVRVNAAAIPVETAAAPPPPTDWRKMTAAAVAILAGLTALIVYTRRGRSPRVA